MLKLFPEHDRAVTNAVVDYIFAGGHLGDPEMHQHFKHCFEHLTGLEQRLIITRCKMAVSRMIVGAIKAELEAYDGRH
ncbi:hypothetical protein ABIA16_003526 [Sinorhizobium fredii]